MRISLSLLLLCAACRRTPPAVVLEAAAPEAARVSEDEPDATPSPREPDGDDDPFDVGAGALPSHGRFVRVGRPPLALTRICDLTPFAGSLYAAHAHQPLGTDGATVTRYDPRDRARPFAVAFDWNRPGEPTAGGGAGQGFLRVHAIGGRLFVPDADPPHDGFGIVDHGTEGYVFVSDLDGRFAPPRQPHFRPPATPGSEAGGAGVVPRAYHVIDVIRFQGRLYASTGSVPPSERAWRGAAPGALHVAGADLGRWTYEVDYPYPWQNGAWRLTFLVRFRDRLFAGIQDYDGRARDDYVVFEPAADAAVIARDDVHPVRVVGGARTLRWFVDAPAGRASRLFWIAAAGGEVALRVTEDGEHWTDVPFPDVAGWPLDVARFRDGLVVLTERRLYRLDDALGLTAIALVEGKSSPFELTDIFCAAPLGVLDGELYAGGQRDGALYRVDWE